MATGLLVVLIGPATRLAPYLSGTTKRYAATVTFGSSTDTDDAEGAVIAASDVPREVLDPAFVGPVVARLVGEHEQVPPAYSAIKVAGRTGYERARRGEDVQLEARRIEVLSALLLAVRPEPVEWDLVLEVTKGTYIRSIARDLGETCGTHAHLSALRRLASGTLSADDALTLDEVDRLAAEGHVALMSRFADPLSSLALPVYTCDPEQSALVRVGGALSIARTALEAAEAGECIVLRSAHELLAVYEIASSGRQDTVVLRPRTVIAGGIRIPVGRSDS